MHLPLTVILIRNFVRLLTVSLLVILAAGLAHAEVAGPGWILGTAEPVSPEEAQAYYKSRGRSLNSAISVPLTQETTTLETTALETTASATEATPEIVELARALQNDPKLIYEFVHNNIDYVPYFGSLKGATLTLLERSGNDFDQASLMIALLRESGLTAQYVYGQMTIPNFNTSDDYDMQHWLGIDPDNTVISLVLGSGGIPATVYASSTVMDRVWVKATISGTDYLFDPAFKIYEETTGIDLTSAMGYDRNALLSAAGGTVGTDYVQNLDDGGLRSQLAGYSANLISYLRSNYPNASMEEIIGGGKIIPEVLDQYSTTLRFSSTADYYWDTIPSAYEHTIRIQHGSIDETLVITDIAGKRLSLNTGDDTLCPGSASLLRLEDEIIGYDCPFSSDILTQTIDHPYAADNGTYADQTSDYTLQPSSVYAIISDFGGSKGGQLLEKRQRILSAYRAGGLSDTSREVLNETLNIMGQTYMQQLTLSDNLIIQLGDVIRTVHHQFGVMAQEPGNGYYVNVATMFGSTISKSNITSERNTAFKTGNFLGSALEHGVLEQLQGADRPAASTIKLMYLANSQGDKIFKVDADNISTVEPQLVNYSAQDIQGFQALVNDGYTIILPEDANIVLQDWMGEGFIIFKELANGDMWHGMVIGGGYYGGYGGINAPVDINTVNTEYVPELWAPVETPTFKSIEPVDLATGAYLFDHEDLALGGAEPNGLHFSRSYNSDNNSQKSALGYGLTHNYDIYVNEHSDVKSGIGLRQPVDAAALMVSYLVTLDLMLPSDPSTKEWMTAVLVNEWAMEQLLENAVTVQLQNKALTYIKLPYYVYGPIPPWGEDNDYNPPPGVTTKLVKNGGTGLYRLEERFGTVIAFDANNKISTWTDVDGNQMTFTYNGTELQTVQDSFDRTFTLNHAGEFLNSVTDSTGRPVSFTYDATGDLMTYTDPESKNWGYAYNDSSHPHRMTSLIDPLSVTSAVNTYNGMGDVITQTVPRQGGGTATYKFYFSDFRNIEEDPYGNQTIYFLDDKGRTTAIENALGFKQTSEFDGQNHVIKETDPRGNITTFTYDGNNNLTNTVNALTQETINIYDTQFHLTDTIDPLLHGSQFGYDSEHHLTSTKGGVTYDTSNQPVDTGLYQTGATYYANGQTQTATDGRNTVTTLTYDTYGNPDTTKVAAHPAIDYGYNAVGQMESLKDQVNSTTTFIYDNRGLVKESTDPLGRKTIIVYDDTGRLDTITDRNNDTINYDYTPSGKMETITYPDATTVSYTYSQHDNLTAMTDPLGTSSYVYDQINRLTSQIDPNNFTVGYTYDTVVTQNDQAGNLTKVTYPGNKDVIYTYDALNRLETVTIDWLSQTTTYIYDSAGRLSQVQNFNGTTTNFDYDTASRLILLENKKSDGTIISSYQFPILDGNGNRVQEVREEPIPPSNLTTENVSFTYNAERNRLQTAGSDTFAFDDEGQLSNKSGTGYTFDYAHRLIGIGSSIQFNYDGAGNRLKVTRSGVTTKYIYDAAGNLLAEADGSNNITAYYIHGAGLLAMVEGSNTYTYHYDATGNTIAMTDQTEAMVNMYAYTPYGRIVNQQETIAQPFKFVGQYGVMTEPSGFYYMRARYYDPEVGRFISQDPIGLEGGINLYAYVGGNPIRLIDPWGLFSWEQLLQDTANYSWAGATTSYFMGPAGAPGVVVFGGLGIAATFTKTAIYSEDPVWDSFREGVKSLPFLKNPFMDKVADDAFDAAVDGFKNNNDSEKRPQGTQTGGNISDFISGNIPSGRNKSF